MTTIRLGVLGAGIMGRRFAAAAASSGRFTVTAVCDIDQGAASEVAAQYGAVARRGIEEVVHGADVDAVYIALPHHLHLPASLAAATAGVHVLIDKPLCTDPGEAERIVAAATRSSEFWGVGFSYRFRSDWRRVHQLISAGAIGAPYFVSDVIVEAYGSTPSWYWDPASGGGVLHLQAHHVFDRHRWILGAEPTRVACTLNVSSQGAQRSAAICADYGQVTANTALSFGLGYDADRPRTLLVVQGESGMIQLDETRTLRLITRTGVFEEDHATDDWATRELAEFADAVSGVRTGFPTVSDGLAALRGVNGAVEAARSGTWVVLDG